MARLIDITPEILEEMKTYYEDNKLSNVQVSDLYREQKVSEKNIRNWANILKWKKRGVEEKVEKRSKPPRKVKKRTVKKKVEKKEDLDKTFAKKTTNPRVAKKMEKEGIDMNTDPLGMEKPFHKEDETITMLMDRVQNKTPKDKRKDIKHFKELVAVVQEMIIGNFSVDKIMRYMIGKFEFTQANVMIIIDIAKKSISRNLEKDMNVVVATQLDTLRMLFRKCIESGDNKTALECSKEMSKIYGLYSAEKVLILGHSSSSQGKKFKASTPLEYKLHQERLAKKEAEIEDAEIVE